jgi:hypothetical protein
MTPAEQGLLRGVKILGSVDGQFLDEPVVEKVPRGSGVFHEVA